MAQKFPEVGLRAVFEITGFQTGYRKYQTMMSDIDKTTKQTAQKVNQTTKGMTGDIAKSFDELSLKSKVLDDLFDRISRGLEKRTQGMPVEEYEKLTAELESLHNASVSASMAFQNLGRNAQVNVGVFDHLVNSGLDFGQAMQVAGGQVQFSLSTFDRLINRGVDAGKAFEVASSGASGLGQSVSILGRSFSLTAVAVTAVTGAIAAGIKFMRDANEAYDELAEATRRVRLQTGLLTQESADWVVVAQAAGISATQSERALTSFLGKIADMRREQVMGEESTSDFAVAMRTLGVSITDNQGNLRTTEQLLNDVNRAFQRLGSGQVSAQLATDLFGFSGRNLLPILVDQEQSIANVASEAERLGATMTSLDRENYEQLRQSNVRLQQSWQGLRLETARASVELRTKLKNALATVLNAYRQFDAALRSFRSTVVALITGATNLGNALDYLRDRYRYLTGQENETARAAEQAAQDRSNAAQKTAVDIEAAERRIREEREKTLKQLDKIKSQLAQKLADIDRDAERSWNDILVQRQRDAMDRALQLSYRLYDLQQAYNERLDDIERDFAKRWDDILVKRQRDAIERAIRLAWRYADLARAAEERRQDAIRDASSREDDIRRETRKRIADAERDAQKKREKLERDHQERLFQIRQQFQDTALEAARNNDAVAVARAMRQRARELRDEQRRYATEKRDLEESLKEKREEIERDRREREEDHRRELARTLQRIEDNYQKQVEELNRQQERERELRELRYQWELEDFNKAKAEQIAAAQEWYDKQLEEIEKQQAREERLRQIQYERQEIDFVKAWQRRIEDAREWYERERDELAAHLDMTGEMLERVYEDWIRAAGDAVTRVVREIADAMAREIERYQHLLTEAERQAARAYQRPAATQPTPTPYPTGPRAPQQPVFGYRPGMAEGGVVQASKPTMVTMGEAGPETAVFMPGRSGNLNVNHNFGRLGVDFQGIPGGMNTQQVQAIVYSVMTQLAKGIQVPR